MLAHIDTLGITALIMIGIIIGVRFANWYVSEEVEKKIKIVA